MSKVKPIFIFCMARSGSTLLQRVLMSHSKISSMAEPHFLLPLAYTLKKEGVLAEYCHSNVAKAVEDIINNLPNKENEYLKYLRELSLGIYTSLSAKESLYFVDKTPSYHWIIPEIERIFPDAKFIFLFRNPIQSISSVLETWGSNRFYRMQMFYLKAFEAFKKLSEGYFSMKSKSFRINYENFIANPENIIKELSDYLEIEYEDNMLSNFSHQETKGRLGDPTGIKKYTTINKQTVQKWKLVFNTNYRKLIASTYIKKFSNESLKIQGYDKQEILREISNLKTNGNHNFFIDFMDIQRIKLIHNFKLNIFFGRNLKWTRKKYLN